MKKLILALTLLIGAVSLSAQNYGYRGSFDTGLTAGSNDNMDVYTMEINTIHGYQFNPFIFVGGGLGLHTIVVDTNDSDAQFNLPLFANFRASFIKTKATPFVDIRTGYYLTNDNGLYGSVSAGLRLRLTEKQSIYFSLGYTLQQLKYVERHSGFYQSYYGTDYYNYSIDYKEDFNGLTIRAAYEF